MTVIQHLAVNRPLDYALKLTMRRKICIIIAIDCLVVVCTVVMTLIPVISSDCFLSKACLEAQVGINIPLTTLILLIQDYCYWRIFFGLRKHHASRKKATTATNSLRLVSTPQRISDDHREFLSNLGLNVVIYTVSAIPISAVWLIYIEFLFLMPNDSNDCEIAAKEIEKLFSNNLKRELQSLMILMPSLYIQTILFPLVIAYRTKKVKCCISDFVCRKNNPIDKNEAIAAQLPNVLKLKNNGINA